MWQGRYKASLVQDDHYLLTCYTYIEQNPVRAGMVRAPGDYSYSSYCHNANGKPDELVSRHPVYQSLAKTPEQRQTAYRALFSTVIDLDTLLTIRETINTCRILGNDKFKDQIEAMPGRSVRPGNSGRPKKSNHPHSS